MQRALLKLILTATCLFLLCASVFAEDSIPQTVNSHDVSCDYCHPKVQGEFDFDVAGIDYDNVEMCQKCHPGINTHPIGIDPGPPLEKIVDANLPLGNHSLKGKIVCLTCHFYHGMKNRTKLLRSDQKLFRNRRENLCSVCHSDTLLTMSPHDPESDSCEMCHVSLPKEKQQLSDSQKKEIQRRCNFCHDLPGDGHYRTANPFADPEVIWRLDKAGLPVFEDRSSCIGCHDPHAFEDRKEKMLRAEYLAQTTMSKLINPHWKNVMCVTCHNDVPEKGKPALRFKGITNDLCNRCHDNKFARAIIHPVGVIPTDLVVIPPDMPLEGGKLTCKTCHEMSLQESGDSFGSIGFDNPRFLRGKYSRRNDFCFSCHPQEVLGKFNAHDQVGPSGAVKEEICLLCHMVNPKIEIAMPVRDERNPRDPTELCVGCHNAAQYRENHPAGPHRVEPSRTIWYTMKSAEDRIGAFLPLVDDMITCITCHDPHQKGVIENDDGYQEVSSGKGLRARSRNVLCTGCHGSI